MMGLQGRGGQCVEKAAIAYFSNVLEGSSGGRFLGRTAIANSSCIVEHSIWGRQLSHFFGQVSGIVGRTMSVDII